MINLQALALNLISRTPQIANNPQAQEYIDIIKSGDAQKGAQIAQNICNTYGETPEQAYAKAQKFFMR